MKLTGDIFAPLSSKIDWCEPNYVHTVYVAELWNTVSNLPMLLLPICMMCLYRNYAIQVQNCRWANLIWMLLLITALGSVYFHATLSLFGQFLDEMGILWICCAVAAFWLPNVYLPKAFNMNRLFYQGSILTVACTATVLSFIKPEINHWFLFSFVVPAIYVLVSETKMQVHNAEFQSIAYSGLYMWIGALLCWVLDRFLCPFWLGIGFPYLHGFWHILVAVGSYKACVCYSYCFALQHGNVPEPRLTFYKFCSSCDWLGLWFVDFKSSGVLTNRV